MHTFCPRHTRSAAVYLSLDTSHIVISCQSFTDELFKAFPFFRPKCSCSWVTLPVCQWVLNRSHNHQFKAKNLRGVLKQGNNCWELSVYVWGRGLISGQNSEIYNVPSPWFNWCCLLLGKFKNSSLIYWISNHSSHSEHDSYHLMKKKYIKLCLFNKSEATLKMCSQ